jgi:putative transposase
MGKVRNLFSVSVGRYTKPLKDQRKAFKAAKALWAEAAKSLVI